MTRCGTQSTGGDWSQVGFDDLGSLFQLHNSMVSAGNVYPRAFVSEDTASEGKADARTS